MGRRYARDQPGIYAACWRLHWLEQKKAASRSWRRYQLLEGILVSGLAAEDEHAGDAKAAAENDRAGEDGGKNDQHGGFLSFSRGPPGPCVPLIGR